MLGEGKYSVCFFLGSYYLLDYWLKNNNSTSHCSTIYLLSSSHNPVRQMVPML